MKIAPETIDDWKEYGKPPATPEDVAAVEALAGTRMPPDYVEFVTMHGFAQWDVAVPSVFAYRLEEPAGTVTREARLSHLRRPDGIARLRKHGWSDDPANGLPVAPDRMFPIGGTDGQGLILLDLEEGGIWYLPEGRQDAWGTGDNTQLGYVAPSFTAFVEGLRPDEAA